MKKVWGLLKEYWGKSLLVVLLGVSCWGFSKASFHSIDFIIRDALQHFNFGYTVDKSIVSVNIDITKNNFTHPLKTKDLISIIDKILLGAPKHIILVLEPSELSQNPEERIAFFNYINSLENFSLFALEDSYFATGFESDEVFRNYKNLFYITTTGDRISASKNDAKFRRALLSYDQIGESQTSISLKKIGVQTKEISDFKYPYKFWRTTQVYMKTPRVGTFTFFQSPNFFTDNYRPDFFNNKLVFIGSFNEFSFLHRPSALNLLNNKLNSNFQDHFYPFQELVANLVNLHITGDYIKYLQSWNDLIVLFIVLTFLILCNFKPKTKLILFFSLIPINLIFIFILYITSSYYIDFSRSISLLIFAQYIVVPLLMFLMMRLQEQQKQTELLNARIDSVLRISEKVAHDIRSPLSVANLLISKAKFDDPEHKNLITSSLKRIDIIAANLLKKYRATNSEMKLEDVNIINTISVILSEKRSLRPNIVFKLSVKTALTHAKSSASELERVISNLIDNSIDATQTQESPQITIELSALSNQFLITISDNGVGISSDMLALLGQQRITSKKDTGGNGIGLLHAKQTIEMMGGTLEISSTENIGTSIVIRLIQI
ncbi:sensor histidine kinase [Pseudobdellovibrio exovorus]|uniref:histidine kinase n=1 Tax=Pseudobdellovibrio exovorus JSS TaxID=1184267 RepID=M4VE55_9BACT|nr:HAMP domain-containing sensor histidine kinase [Pseudobdellovibrio exovorus]AGH96326.1 hypothetical protein A11Q_2110 [Pseudobdellovibrio exovorus JSS]